MATDMLQYLNPDGLNETVLNIGQIKTSLEGQISDLEDSLEEEMQDLPYARPDGIYPDMTVGAVIGADSTAQWTTRESTGSGAATVRSVQGAAEVQDSALVPVRIAGIASTDAQGGELDAIEWTAQTLRAAGSVADMLYSDRVDVKVGVVALTGNESLTAYSYSTYSGFFVSGALPENGDRKAYSSSDFGSSEQGTMVPNTNQFAWLGVNNKLIYLLWADCPYATSADAKAWLAQRYAAGNPVTFFYALNDPITTPISPALPMTYRFEQGGNESIIVPDGEVSAAPIMTVAEPVNAGDEFARIWEAIQSLGYTRDAAQLSRPVSLTDIGSIDEVQKDTAEIAEIDTTKEVQE